MRDGERSPSEPGGGVDPSPGVGATVEALLDECEEWLEQAAHALDNAEPDDRVGIGAAHHNETAKACHELADRLTRRRMGGK